MLTTLDERTALVLIDLQAGILGGTLLHPAADIVGHAARLAAAFRRAQLPVVLVTVNPVGPPWTLVRAQAPAYEMPKDAASQAATLQYLTDSGFFTLAPALNVQPTDVQLTKTTWSAFYETGLHELLRAQGITEIVLGGTHTSIGVEATARAASERGYHLALVEDAMTDVVASAHAHSLSHIFPQIGEIGTTDEVLALLAKRG